MPCSDCQSAVRDQGQRTTLTVALVLNATMFVVGITAGWLAQSSGLLADALDMLADALAYALALLAFHRSARFKARAAVLSGCVLLALGIGVLVDAARRALGAEVPFGGAMMAVASVAFVVNSFVLMRLSQARSGEVHLRAAWLFTRADILANVGVIISGAIVTATHVRWPDLLIGAAIGIFVIHEAAEILRSAREAFHSEFVSDDRRD